MPKTDIFNYFSYREYLADFYKYAKSVAPSFSHRAFLKKADISGSAYLQRVISGQRNLSPKYIKNFVAGLGLNEKEARYFKALVKFDSQKDTAKKERYLRELLVQRNARSEYRIKDEKLRYYQKWYYPVIRTLIACEPFSDNYRHLAGLVVPRITEAQAKEAMVFLDRNGFIRKNSHGVYEVTNPIMATAPEVNSTILVKYHEKILTQARDVLRRIKREERDVSFLTVGVSKKTYYEIKKEIQLFRKRILALAEQDPNPEIACGLGMQLFPRSKIKTWKRRK